MNDNKKRSQQPDIETVDSEGTPVEYRIKSPEVFRNMHDDFVRADVNAALARTKIINLINGAKPYSAEKQRDRG